MRLNGIHLALSTAVAVGLVAGAVHVGPAAQGAAVKRSDAVVKASASADKPGADGKQVVTVTLKIEDGWHIYANPVGNEDLTSSQTKVTVEGKKAEDVQIDYPTGKLTNIMGDKLSIYEGEVAIKATLNRAKDDAPLKLKVKFQACNEKSCLQPATVELTVQ